MYSKVLHRTSILFLEKLRQVNLFFLPRPNPMLTFSFLYTFLYQIEDLSQQAHKAAAEKFKVPVTSTPLAPPIPPRLSIKEESDEEEEEEVANNFF